jgi:hypothetical protein
MPNWCSNSLKITPTKPRAKTLMVRIEHALEEAKEGRECRLFDTIHPMPEELINTVCGSVAEDKREAHHAQMEANKTKYGYPTWYEFANAEWGTKWDACEVTYEKRGKSLVIWFDTAWSPPMGIYTKLESIGFEVEATYCEAGIGYAGIYRNGTDDEHNISFWDEDNEGCDDIENMEEFFHSQGVDHSPSHTGG